MSAPGQSSIALRAVVLSTAGYAFLGGAVSLLGWILDVPRMMDWEGNGIWIKVNAAICATCAALGLVVSQLRPNSWLLGLRRLLGVFVFLAGGLTLLQHLGGLDFGIDTLLFDEPPGAAATVAPGRMGPPASTCFSILGATLLLGTGGMRARK